MEVIEDRKYLTRIIYVQCSLTTFFRPIALSSVIGKTYHKILASHQKGFLCGISGVHDHILTLNTVTDNARKHILPLYMMFIDLWNAFGSTQHNLISDMAEHIHLPLEITSYIANLYSKLTAFVLTPKWVTPTFPVTRGIFQGDNEKNRGVNYHLCKPVVIFRFQHGTTSAQLYWAAPHQLTFICQMVRRGIR